MKQQYKVHRTCPICKKVQAVEFKNKYDYRAYVEDGYTQFMYLGSSAREALKTGLCDKCWDDLTKVG